MCHHMSQKTKLASTVGGVLVDCQGGVVWKKRTKFCDHVLQPPKMSLPTSSLLPAEMQQMDGDGAGVDNPEKRRKGMVLLCGLCVDGCLARSIVFVAFTPETVFSNPTLVVCLPCFHILCLPFHKISPLVCLVGIRAYFRRGVPPVQ